MNTIPATFRQESFKSRTLAY